jgi:hypothetical protein
MPPVPLPFTPCRGALGLVGYRVWPLRLPKPSLLHKPHDVPVDVHWLYHTPSRMIVRRGATSRRTRGWKLGCTSTQQGSTGQATIQATASSRASRARHVGFDPTLSEAPINKPSQPACSRVHTRGNEKKKEAHEQFEPTWGSARPRERNPSRKKGSDKSYANMSPMWALCASRSLVCRVGGGDAGTDKARVKRPTRNQTISVHLIYG